MKKLDYILEKNNNAPGSFNGTQTFITQYSKITWLTKKQENVINSEWKKQPADANQNEPHVRMTRDSRATIVMVFHEIKVKLLKEEKYKL